MSFKWQDKHMELFLEAYKQYECLWNNKCSNYSKLDAREKAYSLMLNDINIPGLTVADIKAKIKTIRTRYGAELAKIRNSERNRVAGEQVYEPRLFWFKDADEFLRKVCNSKPSYFMMRDPEVAEKASTNNDACTHYEDYDSTSPENSRNSPVLRSFSNTSANLRYRKNVLKRSLCRNDSAVKSSIKKIKQTSDDTNEGPNEFDYFCESLAIQLKRMPLQRAIICQEKLQSVMTQERLFQLSEPHHTSSLPITSACQHSLNIGSLNSEQFSMKTPISPRIESNIRSDTTTQNHLNEGDNESENTFEVKREISI